MEARSLDIRAVEFNNALVHIITLEAGTKMMMSREAEWALYNTYRNCGSLFRRLETLGLPAPIMMKRGALKLDMNATDYNEIIRSYREFQTALSPLANATPKNISLVMIDSVIPIAIERGNQKLLEALGCRDVIPEQWLLQEESDLLHRDGYVDLLLEERIKELEEERIVSIQEELVEYEPYPDDADEEKIMNYALQPCRALESQLASYVDWKCKTFAFDRASGAAVAEITARADVKGGLRFLGYLKHQHGNTLKDLKQLKGIDPALLQRFCDWLIQRPVTHGTVGNYLNSVCNLLGFVSTLPNEESDEESDDAGTSMIDRLTEAAFTLRNQAESAAKRARLYKPQHPELVTWEEAKQTRLNASEDMEQTLSRRPFNREKAIKTCRATLLIMLNTIHPPDRTGCIRLLCVPDTLKRQENGSYYIDTTQFKHKTSKWYGPSMVPIAEMITPVIDKYLELTQSFFEFTEYDLDEPMDRTRRRYLFAQAKDPTRALDPSAYTSLFKAAFETYSPRACSTPPSLLRKVFITWMKDSTNDQKILDSAAAMQKHSTRTQANVYDLKTHLRAAAAASNFCLAYANLPVCTPNAQDKEEVGANNGGQLIEQEGENDAPSIDLGDNMNPSPALTAQQAVASGSQQEGVIRLITAGEVVQGHLKHRILWDEWEDPKMFDWWGDLEDDYFFESSEYVPREISISVDKHSTKLGLIASVVNGGQAEIVFCDASTGRLNLHTCEFRETRGALLKVVPWCLTRPGSWNTEAYTLTIINDSLCDFTHNTESNDARNEWTKNRGKLYPTIHESMAIMLAIQETVCVDTKELHSELSSLITPILEWNRNTDPSLVPTALNNVIKLSAMLQTGSCLHDACGVLTSHLRDAV